MGLIDIRRRILADSPVLAEASGSIASFNTDMAAPLKACQFSIEPVQSGSGDPSPSNVRPISGWTGANISRTGINIWDEQWELGSYNNTTGAKNDSTTDRIRCKNLIPIKGGLSYYVPWNMNFSFYDADGNILTASAVTGFSLAGNTYIRTSSNTQGAFPVPSSAVYMKFYLASAYGTTYNNDISINYPSTDTAYHPYTGNQIPVTFPAQGKNLLPFSTGLEMRTIATNSGGNYFYVLNGLKPNTNYTLQVTITSEWDTASGRRLYVYPNGGSASNMYIGTSGCTTQTTRSKTAQSNAEGQLTVSHNSNALNDDAYAASLTNIQLEEGSTATSYEPYTNTVYGGTVDVTTGVLTVTWAKIVLNGTETWTSSGGLYTGVPMLAKLQDYSNAIYADKLNTSIYQTSMSANSITGYKDISERYPNNNWIYAKVDGVTTAADITAWLAQNPVEVVYQLAHPIIYQLTPQQITALKGQNNVWCDTGNTSVKYWKH